MGSPLVPKPYNRTHQSGRQEGKGFVSGVPEERSALHAYLSPEAHGAWAFYSEENGVSLTSLLEALGMELRGELEHVEAHDLRQDWIKRARRIDANRRRRGSR